MVTIYLNFPATFDNFAPPKIFEMWLRIYTYKKIDLEIRKKVEIKDHCCR